jgi:4-alpha-glucanotransferase
LLSASTNTLSHVGFADEFLERFGIQPEYHDLWGRSHRIQPEVAAAILASLGVRPEDAASPLPLAPPASVLSPGERFDIEPRFAWLPVEIVCHWDSGSRTVLRGPADGLLLPADAPLGYHRLEVRCGADHVTGYLIVCPEKCVLPTHRMRGVAVSLYSLRSHRNQGCGDFTDLRNLASWASQKMQADFIALNPLHAIPNRQPYNTSPYLPTTTLYRNFLYLDLAEVEGCPALAAYESRFAELRATPCVEYEKVAALKLEILRQAFASSADWSTNPAFAAYRAEQGESLQLFATYCVLDETIHRANPDIWLWQDWPAEYQDPASPAVPEFASKHSQDVLFYEWLQWQIDIQLGKAQKHATDACGMHIGLYHDLALAVDRSGFDAWAFRDFYIKGCRVGSPPDDFAPEGQDWSFPPPNVKLHRESGYRQFIATIRNNARHGGALRLDHVMRLFRLFWIPDGFPAASGAYVRDHARDLLRILALESVRANVLIIGEDLGTITDEMRAGLHNAGILSYRLLYFERHGDGRFRLPHEYPKQAIVCTTTHDLPTIAGFWSGHDIEVRRRVGLILDEVSYEQQKAQRRADKQRMIEALTEVRMLKDPVDLNEPALPEAVRKAILRYLQFTPAYLFAVTQDDLTGFIDQQNVPGTTWQHPNWSHKMPVTIEELATWDSLAASN